MSQLIHIYAAEVRDPYGGPYQARAMGRRREDGTWEGWLEFIPLDGAGRALRSDRETAQPDRTALNYWAGGIEPVYLEGALKRARDAERRGSTRDDRLRAR